MIAWCSKPEANQLPIAKAISIDISVNGRHLSRERGFLLISEGHAEIARVPLDDIGAIIVHAHGVTYTNSLLVELANRGVIFVLFQ